MQDFLFNVIAFIFFLVAQLFVDVNGILQTCKPRHNPELDDRTTNSWLFREFTPKNSSAAKLECAIKCVKHPSCVTYMVNKNSGVCRFYGARITRFNNLVIAPGFKSFDTCRAGNVFGEICVIDDDCLLPNSLCIDNTCQCDEGWSYSPNSLSCIRECVKYGTEFTGFEQSYIAGHDEKTLTAPQYQSASGCGAACVAETTFVCKTFDLDNIDGLCLLQAVTPYDVPLSSLLSILSQNQDFYQRHCAYVES